MHAPLACPLANTRSAPVFKLGCVPADGSKREAQIRHGGFKVILTANAVGSRHRI